MTRFARFGGVGGHLRLPSAPSDYEQGFMARFINSLEIDKQLTYFAASTGLENAVDRAEATAWFMG
jgi:hypothetical protein